MHAHRVRVQVLEGEEVRVKLPSDFPPGEADVIVIQAQEAKAGARRYTVDELLAHRLTPPPGVGPVTLDDMERAIVEGAAGRGGL